MLMVYSTLIKESINYFMFFGIKYFMNYVIKKNCKKLLDMTKRRRLVDSQVIGKYVNRICRVLEQLLVIYKAIKYFSNFVRTGAHTRLNLYQECTADSVHKLG